MQQPVSTMANAKQMMADLWQILKLAFTSKFGLTITFLCATIYFFTLWFNNIIKKWSLITWILTLIGTLVFTWLTWFSK
jgi:hypothetical protein